MSACVKKFSHFLSPEGIASDALWKEKETMEIQSAYRMDSETSEVFLREVRKHLPMLLPSFFMRELQKLPGDPEQVRLLFQRLHAELPSFMIIQPELQEKEVVFAASSPDLDERASVAAMRNLHGFSYRAPMSLERSQDSDKRPEALLRAESDPANPHWMARTVGDGEKQSWPQTLSALFLCPAQFVCGVDRYIKDTLSKWLVPGKQVPIVGELGLNFHFTKCPEMDFLFCKHLVGMQNNEEKIEILRNMPSILNEMKLNIMASYQASYIISMKNYSQSYKSLLIKDGLSSLLNRYDDTFYEQIQALISQRTSEERIRAVEQNLHHLLQMRPKAFNRNIFYEMTRITALIQEQFASNREPRNISRLIAHYYLFKKFVESKVKLIPQQRHLSVKVSPVPSSGGSVISVLVVMNFLSDSERFEKNNMVDAMDALVADLECLDRPFISDRREGNILFMYAEFAKTSRKKFTLQEIQECKNHLSREIVRHVEKVVHPVFMPRNEEELFRNLVLLSKEIKYVRDLPQVSIHYEKQTNDQLVFTVLIVRLKRPNSLCLHQIFANGALCVEIEDLRILNQLKRRHPKESSILRVFVEKSLFFRPDFSVDLLRARQRVASGIADVLGEFRDFNGGMIIKQEEMLSALRKQFHSLTRHQEFFLENYFYSLRPVVAQTIFEANILRVHFEMLLGCIERHFSSVELFHATEENYELYFIVSPKELPKLDLRRQITETKKDSHILTSCSIQLDRVTAVGFICRKDRTDIVQKIEQFARELQLG